MLKASTEEYALSTLGRHLNGRRHAACVKRREREQRATLEVIGARNFLLMVSPNQIVSIGRKIKISAVDMQSLIQIMDSAIALRAKGKN